jgi:hypothetical protein
LRTATGLALAAFGAAAYLTVAPVAAVPAAGPTTAAAAPDRTLILVEEGAAIPGDCPLEALAGAAHLS